MEIMRFNDKGAEFASVTIGNFDGVHIGHRRLIERTKEVAARHGYVSAVITFTPHPRSFFGDENLRLITLDDEKAAVLSGIGIDFAVFAGFDKALSSLTPVEFIETILVRRFKCKYAVVGKNFTFGKGKSGNADVFADICMQFGIEAEIAASVKEGGMAVSSERIRAVIAEGNICRANRLLGQPFFVLGEIRRGRGIGSEIGFPTMNLLVSDMKLLPKFGVYFTETRIDGNSYNGITNVGVRPTFGGGSVSVETFLLGYGDWAYGKTAAVKFLRHVRDEMMFDNTECLKEAIECDVIKAKEFFEAEKDEK